MVTRDADWDKKTQKRSPFTSAAYLLLKLTNTATYNQYYKPPAEGCAEQLHFFHGVNPRALLFPTNMYAYGGDRCTNEIYHTYRRMDQTGIMRLPPATVLPPGYMPGGPNVNYAVNTSLRPPYGQPAQKSYLDFNTGWPDNSWEITEPAIYYQAAYTLPRCLLCKIRKFRNRFNLEKSSDILIDVSELPAGIYSLKLTTFGKLSTLYNLVIN